MSEQKHHKNGPICALCEWKFNQADPRIMAWFNRLKLRMSDVHASWVFRGEADQNQAFAEGKSKLQWPNSKHNHISHDMPYAQACDLFQLGDDGVARFPFKYFQDIALDNVERNEPIKWGGNFKTLSDQDHFELITSDSG